MDPFGHTGYVPGRRKDIEVGVVGKNRIMKYIQTGFQHFIQRIDTSKCKLEFTVPVRISVKGLLYLVERILQLSEKQERSPEPTTTNAMFWYRRKLSERELPKTR